MTDYEKGYDRGRDEILAMKENADLILKSGKMIRM